MLLVFVKIQTEQYLEGQTATRVTRLVTNETKLFPPVWFLHTNWSWIDAEKVKSHGITREEILILMGHFVPHTTYNSTVPVAEAKERLKQTMKRLRMDKILELCRLIALDSIDGSSPPHTVLKPFVGDRGIGYYRINTSGATEAPGSDAWLLTVSFNFSSYRQNQEHLWSFLEWDRNRYASEWYPPLLANLDGYQFVGLEPDSVYMISTYTDIYKKMGRCAESDSPNEPYYTVACHLECELRANASLEAASCMFLLDHDLVQQSVEATETYLTENISFCHLGVLNVATGQVDGKEEPVFKQLTSEQLRERAKTVAACRERCLPRCEQWSTFWSVTSYAYVANHTVDTCRIRLVFQASNNLVVIEEIRQYQWHDLVSDLGGLLGLWLGASMMSIVQVVHLCLWPPRKKFSKGIGTRKISVKSIGVGTDCHIKLG